MAIVDSSTWCTDYSMFNHPERKTGFGRFEFICPEERFQDAQKMILSEFEHMIRDRIDKTRGRLGMRYEFTTLVETIAKDIHTFAYAVWVEDPKLAQLGDLIQSDMPTSFCALMKFGMGFYWVEQNLWERIE